MSTSELYKDWEKLSEKVYRTRLENDRIIVYKVLDSSRQSVDAWADGILDLYKDWDPENLYLAVYDLSAVVALSPYARKRTREIVDSSMHLQGRYGVVLSNSLVSFAINLFVRRELDRTNRNFIREFFATREEAIEWLKQWID